MEAKEQNNNRIRQMTMTALMCAVLCLLCPVSVPVGPVPVSLGVFALLLTAFVLPPVQALAACLLYLLLGAAGLPVFAGYQAGFARVLGPTGGYLAGYLPLVWISAFGVRISFLRTVPAAGERAEQGAAAAAHGKKTALQLHVLRAAIQGTAMLGGLLLLYAAGTAWFVISTEGMTVPAALGICVLPFLPFDLLKIAAALVAGNALYTALLRARLLSQMHSN